MAVGKYAQSRYASRIIVLVVLVGGCVVPDVDSLEYLSVGTAPRLFITGPPFSEAGAAGALAVSRRQSKWIEVEQSGSGQGIGTWVVRPQHQNSSSVVIVIHEIFGVNDWVLAVADKLAENGFVALVPDLVSGLGPNGGGTTSVASRHQVIGLLRGLNQDEKFARLAAVRAGLPVETSATTVNRFCSSGLQTISMAAQRVVSDQVPIMVAGGVESISLVQNNLNQLHFEEEWLITEKPEPSTMWMPSSPWRCLPVCQPGWISATMVSEPQVRKPVSGATRMPAFVSWGVFTH